MLNLLLNACLFPFLNGPLKIVAETVRSMANKNYLEINIVVFA